ncbi:MAG: hypothetical protein IPK03_13540 [Bacteroidetes bacterium]|nr:hypothetical protein [Bacteroidota bacterium]
MPLRILSIFFFFISACGTSKVSESNNEIQATQPSIYFLTFKIFRRENSKMNAVELVNKTLTAGTMKGKDPEARQFANNLIIFYYRKSLLLDSLIIDHPLYKHLEYTDESRKFAVKDTMLPSADFFFRFQTAQMADELSIVEQQEGQIRQELKRIKL